MVERLQRALLPLSTPPQALPAHGYRPESAVSGSSTDAAVLVPVLRENQHILLTVRCQALSRHAGQVAFPGGMVDPHDRGPVATALRETWEEVGIASEKVQPLGFVDRYETITGFVMVPVVGLVDAGVEDLHLNAGEVSEVFTIPLAHALDATRYRHHQVVWRGETHEVLTLEHPEHFIWGATAAVLDCLRRRVEFLSNL